MTTLTTDKIISELNNYFEKGYQYVFWYDPNKEFKDIINNISKHLNAKLYQAQANQQFKTKVELLKDKNNPYLIYAPYERPKIQVNFLTDMEHYSKLFTADATQIILEELDLNDNKLQFVKQYHSFFNAKSRRETFKRYWSEDFNSFPEKGILAAITKVEKLDVNELLMKVISEGTDGENKFLFDFAKYKVLDAFWKVIADHFAYSNKDQSLTDLMKRLFITYLANELNGNISSRLSNYALKSVDNSQIFIDRFSDSNRYRQYYDNESLLVWMDLDLKKILNSQSLTDLSRITIFEEINELVLDKLISRFDNQKIIDYEQVLSIVDIMLDKTRSNYSKPASHEYKFIRYAAELLNLRIPLLDDWHKELASYVNEDYQIDTIYRKALLAYTDIRSNRTDRYVEIKKMLDLYYGNVLLTNSVKQWNSNFDLAEVTADLKQANFYHNYVDHNRERIVVIFSDALRYEVAKELEDELNSNDRLTLKMDYALTGLPSVTYTGMNVMLPHRKLTWDVKNSKVRVDDMNAEGTDNRTKILQSYDENNLAAQLKDVLNMTSKEIKQMITGKNVIYLYHNQIDAKGHELKTTRELVAATEKAIREISDAIQVLRTNGISHIIVTADHGFIYQEREISDADKIDLSDQQYRGQAHLRYLITPDNIDVMGIKHATMGVALDNDDQTNIYYPISPNVFVARSGSKNYVHGGSSLQEMVIPVLDIRATSKRSKAKSAKIKLAATNFKINNLKMNLLFNQVSSISDLTLPAEYKAYFTDETGNMISNSVTIEANRTGSAADRTIPVTITIQDAKYDYDEDYYLVIEQVDSENKSKKYKYSMELLENRHYNF